MVEVKSHYDPDNFFPLNQNVLRRKLKLSEGGMEITFCSVVRLNLRERYAPVKLDTESHA